MSTKKKVKKRSSPQRRQPGPERERETGIDALHPETNNTRTEGDSAMDDDEFVVLVAALIYSKPGSHSLADSIAQARNLIALVNPRRGKQPEDDQEEEGEPQR